MIGLRRSRRSPKVTSCLTLSTHVRSRVVAGSRNLPLSSNDISKDYSLAASRARESGIRILINMYQALQVLLFQTSNKWECSHRPSVRRCLEGEARHPFRIVGLSVLVLVATGCYSTDTVIRKMTWAPNPRGSGVQLSFVCAPNQRIGIESPELALQLQALNKDIVQVRFRVNRPWFGNAITFDVVAIDEIRSGKWRTANGYMESTDPPGKRSLDPLGGLCE